jgi:hypothetical protein
LAPSLDATIKDQFGITSEIVLAISDFKTIQPRTVQAIDEFFQARPAKGRVDQTIFFMVRGSFTDFINTCNRCFVESVVNLGKTIGKRNYLNDDIAKAYPYLYDAMVRIRLYRNNVMHLLLFEGVDAQLRTQLSKDFRNQRLSDLDNPYGLLQQVVLDGLFVGFQLELDRRS